MLRRYSLALALVASSAQAATIPVFADVATFQAQLYEYSAIDGDHILYHAIPMLRASQTAPVSFHVTGHVDTQALTLSLDSFSGSGPTVGPFSFTSSTPDQPIYYDPPGFDPPYQIGVFPGTTLSATWTWASNWELVPLSSSATIDPVTLDARLTFQPLTLGTLSLYRDGALSSTVDVTGAPSFVVTCRQGPPANCESGWLLASGKTAELESTAQVRLDDVYSSSVPEPSSTWLLLLAAAVARGARGPWAGSTVRPNADRGPLPSSPAAPRDG